ncbi:glyoxalase [Rhodohalobacter sp. SW132]|uniref:VOC family protein n=1 Tax=Rhodohalobacter sp. SW132 TaxID=2293433 RepID=UPI000E28612A|nr:VOC family protein [Rhodohalobacter sp. SW132]REL38240.1 glyoxalase [Rhodohalobacter sp. SW132]
MPSTYKAPESTSVGHIHLKVTDLGRALKFYRDLLGFELTTMYGDQAAFLSAGGYHHHIGLNTWHSKGGAPAQKRAAGLYHTAFLYPTRKDLARIVKRLIDLEYPISGASDHGVSEAIYLNDPDGNGVELYRDRPKEQWNYREDGSIEMVTEPLDIEGLLKELEAD